MTGISLLKSKKFFYFFLLNFFLFTPFLCLAEDSITITTYYPSPYGVYREMRAKRLAIGDNYIDNPDYTWEETNGDGGEIDYLADLVVEGNVGIGTTSPDARLQVYNTATATGLFVQTTVAAETTAVFQGGGTGAVDVLDTRNSEGSSLFKVRQNGNVGIGTTSPTAFYPMLEVYGASQPGMGLKTPNRFFTTVANNGGNVNAFYSSSGNYTIGTATNSGGTSFSPKFTLDSSGKMYYSSPTNSTLGYYLCWNASSYEVTYGSSCAPCSRRFKENIKDSTYGLDAVIRLRPVLFNFKPEYRMGTSTQIGFIAEEIKSVIPEVVNYDADGKISGLNYDQLTAVLTNAIKEQQNQIDALKQEISQIKASKFQ
ncbi:MAG: tail fiber domain-containing protein [Candidatus Omnitrophica bacterium]|nr:tail fiber domain-containing protein [Candidatus Omnitrophota bacterium]